MGKDFLDPKYTVFNHFSRSTNTLFRVKQYFYGPSGNLLPHSFDVHFSALKVIFCVFRNEEVLDELVSPSLSHSM